MLVVVNLPLLIHHAQIPSDWTPNIPAIPVVQGQSRISHKVLGETCWPPKFLFPTGETRGRPLHVVLYCWEQGKGEQCGQDVATFLSLLMKCLLVSVVQGVASVSLLWSRILSVVSCV